MPKVRYLRAKLLASGLMGVLSSVSIPAAHAWNPFGHMLVAYVAYQNLKPEVKERASKLLRLNPYYENWKQQAGAVKSPEELDMRIFMLAATWPDVIKGDKAYTADGGMNGFRPSGRAASQNTGYDDKNLHMYWHFYDEPFSNDKTSLPEVPAPNAETQVAAFRKVLASDAADELKSYDLTWLIHIVGDIHQPLHSVTRVSDKYKEGDNGGNLVKLRCSDCPPNYNLHTFWDAALGSTGDPKTTPETDKVIEEASHLAKANKKLSKNLDVDKWIEESFKLAKNSVYKPLGKGQSPFELTDKYKNESKEIAEKQGELAGERLANLLNSELK